MILVRAVVRPEKAETVMADLLEAGFPAVTRVHVAGRGKQRGLKVGEVTYDEIAKELLIIAIPAADKDIVISTIIKAAKTAKNGAFGDGKIFVSPIEEVYTVSSGAKEL